MTGAELLQLMKAAYEIYVTVDKLTNPDPATIWNLYNSIVGTEIAIVRISRDLENITHEVRRSQAIEINRAVDGHRAAYTAALVFSADHPGDKAGEVAALTASLALSSPSYYTFPGRKAGSPDRFDPRATLPSFLIAVSTWLAIRKMNSSAWTTSSRDSLSQLASSLESHIGRMEQSVVCLEKYSSYDHPLYPPREPPRILEPLPAEPPQEVEQPPITEPRCHHSITCIDSMTESDETLFYEDSAGDCGGNGWSFNDQSKAAYLDKNYQLAQLRDIARSWRIRATT
jgi:hypothetical protein